MDRKLPKWLNATKPENYHLVGEELVAANLLRGYLASLSPKGRRAILRKLIPAKIDLTALVVILEKTQEYVVLELHSQSEKDSTSDRLRHYTRKAAVNLASVNFAVLRKGISSDFSLFLHDLKGNS